MLLEKTKNQNQNNQDDTQKDFLKIYFCLLVPSSEFFELEFIFPY